MRSLNTSIHLSHPNNSVTKSRPPRLRARVSPIMVQVSLSLHAKPFACSSVKRKLLAQPPPPPPHQPPVPPPPRTPLPPLTLISGPSRQSTSVSWVLGVACRFLLTLPCAIDLGTPDSPCPHALRQTGEIRSGWLGVEEGEGWGWVDTPDTQRQVDSLDALRLAPF